VAFKFTPSRKRRYEVAPGGVTAFKKGTRGEEKKGRKRKLNPPTQISPMEEERGEKGKKLFPFLFLRF